jgi:hypothetical protein
MVGIHKVFNAHESLKDVYFTVKSELCLQDPLSTTPFTSNTPPEKRIRSQGPTF